MAFSMYDACVPVCAQMMSGLSGVLGKAVEQAAAKKFEDAALLADRLYPDMFTLRPADPPGHRLRAQRAGPVGRRHAAGLRGGRRRHARRGAATASRSRWRS